MLAKLHKKLAKTSKFRKTGTKSAKLSKDKN